MNLVFASNNAHKLDEVRAIMPAHVRILSLHDIGFEQEIEENGTTLEANSAIKAEAVYQWINRQSSIHQSIDGVFADDTGLEIDALHGEPGVYTARWYSRDGERVTVNGEREIFAANRAKALRELADKADRGAQFRTVITLIKLSAISSQLSEIQVTVLDGRGQFSEGLVVAFRNEDRVVSESAYTVFLGSDSSAYHAANLNVCTLYTVRAAVCLLKTNQCDHGAELGTSVGFAFQFLQSLCPIGRKDHHFIIERRSRAHSIIQTVPTRGVHTRLTV